MNLANRITMLRIFLVPLFVASIVYLSPERPWLLQAALAFFALACLTDALDGWVARRFLQKTRLGSYIDPIADKLLLLSGYGLLAFWGVPDALKIPAWVAIAVIARDIVIVIGAVLIFFITNSLKAEPTLLGKATTLAQMSALLAVLAGAPPPLRDVLYVLVTALTVLSGLTYVRIGGRLLQPL